MEAAWLPRISDPDDWRLINVLYGRPFSTASRWPMKLPGYRLARNQRDRFCQDWIRTNGSQYSSYI